MEESEKYPVGAKVRIKKSSCYCNGYESNPFNDVVGIILKNDNEKWKDDQTHIYEVKWPKGRNSYRHSDLELEFTDVVVNTYEIF